MTTTLYKRSSEIGSIAITESILAYMPEYNLEQTKEKLMDIEDVVNKRLPGSYIWQVMTSEILVAVDESYELTEEEFWEIENKAFYEVIGD